MRTSKLQVYDPPMCCSSGVCGINVNPELARFASDLEWLGQQGVEVERFGLSSQPAAFVAQEAVAKALKEEGDACLPLVVVDNLIVSKGVYPPRAKLAEFAGLEAAPAEEKAAGCGSGCCCCGGGSQKLKIAVCLAVFLAVAGVLAYKAATKRETTPARPAFSVAGLSASTAAAPDSKRQENGQKAWPGLESFAALNQVAVAQDAVFIFVPNAKGEAADGKTNAAAMAAQQALKAKNIALGLYVLPTNAPDYAAVSAQVRPPAMLVVSKGRGMAAVTGEMSEAKLLQAYMASSQAGGCGPSGCGPSGCK